MTSSFVKAYRRIQENRYKGPISIDITCEITRAYGIACPVCWHDLPTNDECEYCVNNRDNVDWWKRVEVSKAFDIPINILENVNRQIFVP